MITLQDCGIYLVCFLLGALPFSVWIGRAFFKVDVRQHGSGNPGATNMLRTAGPGPAALVLLLDIAKGAGAVLLAWYTIQSSTMKPEEWAAIGGLMAILGHIFSPFLRFKGGKGVATAVGVIAVLHPFYGLLVLPFFLLILIVTRYVSLGSILSVWLYAGLMIANQRHSTVLVFFALLLALLITVKHRANIKRLLEGTENKLKLRKQNSS